MLLQGRGGGWQLFASSSLSKLFIDLAALRSPVHPRWWPLPSPHLHESLPQFEGVLSGRAHLLSPQMLYMDPYALQQCRTMTRSVRPILRRAVNIHHQPPETKHSLKPSTNTRSDPR